MYLQKEMFKLFTFFYSFTMENIILYSIFKFEHGGD